MKRNIIKDMTAPKGLKKTWVQRWDIVPRIICLLMALLIWLAVEDVFSHTKPEGEQTAEVETVE